MKVLELFSGTHSVGKVCKKLGHEVISLDRDLGPTSKDYISLNHLEVDILEWDYKKDYKEGDFDLITASPVCLWWSTLRLSNIGKPCRKGRWNGKIYTREMMELDIIEFGIPMVDKIFEILDYFKPKYWWIENPKLGRMKEYINDLIPFVDMDYCQFGLPYKKSTRFWTNLIVKSHKCTYNCGNIIIENGKKTKRHTHSVDGGKPSKGVKSTNKLTDRYRIPAKLIELFISSIE